MTESRGIRVTVHKMGSRFRSAPALDGLTQLVFLSVCFMAGALGGFFFSAWSGDNPALFDYLCHYFQAMGREGSMEPSLWSSIWDLSRWPFTAFLLGCTAFGAVGIPVLLGARGFLLSFSAATFTRLFGLSGMAAALTAFGISALVAVPVLFVVSADAFRQSLGRLSGERSPTWCQRVQALTPCAGLLVLAVVLQQTVMPALFAAVCARLFIL